MSKAKYVTGLRAVEQLMTRSGGDVVRLYAEYQSANPRVQHLISIANAGGIEIQSANRARLQQLSGESRHQGIVAEIRRPLVWDENDLRTMVEKRLTEDDAPSLLLLILDGLQDPHNLGACLRTADAAGVDAVVVPRHGSASLGPTVSKVAAGAAETLPFAAVANLARVLGWLAEYGIRIVGTGDAADNSLYGCDMSGPTALVMGREHTGLKKNIAARCDELVSLPMQGQDSSLNE